MGAKNHTSVMPDANKNHAVNSVVGAAFGAAGQRCMALSVAVMVGEVASSSFISRKQTHGRIHGFYLLVYSVSVTMFEPVTAGPELDR